ncbi:MAG: endonuclease VII domain-containing protein [Candidatus Paceibacterota bacterium]
MKSGDFVYTNTELKIGEVAISANNVGQITSCSGSSCSVFFVKEGIELEVDEKTLVLFDVDETGDAYAKKICNVCHKLKDTEEFEYNQTGINNRKIRRPTCKDCRKVMTGTNMSSADRKKWRESKPEREPFECPICGKRTIAGITSKVVLEHDHKTGNIRGWVCDSCNTGLGRFKDDRMLLEKAIKFLEGS